jgi:putative tryptophan/tyrosine transport system substrate-binding protein
MRRREFITLIGGVTLSWSFDAQAQKEPVRLAFLGSGAAESSAIFLEALKDGLRENGLIERRDYIIDVRWANGAYDRFPAFARELAQSNPRVMLVTTIAAARAAQWLVPSIPVVMTGLINPVDSGLIKSLARPGGNTTGVSLRFTIWRTDGPSYVRGGSNLRGGQRPESASGGVQEPGGTRRHF